ncbi:hypothetical protein CCACVL1_06329, partial [Corchorus capsularis]
EVDDLTLRRFLRARDLDVEKASGVVSFVRLRHKSVTKSNRTRCSCKDQTRKVAPYPFFLLLDIFNMKGVLKNSN